MSTIVMRCEDCEEDFDAVGYWLGPDEDGRDQYELERAAASRDDRHLTDDHDVSLLG